MNDYEKVLQLANDLQSSELPVFCFNNEFIDYCKQTPSLTPLINIFPPTLVEAQNGLLMFSLKQDLQVVYTTIWRLLSKLKGEGYVSSHNFNRSRLKCTIWYPSSFDIAIEDKPSKQETLLVSPNITKLPKRNLLTMVDKSHEGNHLSWAKSAKESQSSIFITRTIINIFQAIFLKDPKDKVTRKVELTLPSVSSLYDVPVTATLRCPEDSQLPLTDDIVNYGALIKCVTLSRGEHFRRGTNLSPSERMSFQVPINSIIEEVNITEKTHGRNRASVIASLTRLNYATITIKPTEFDFVNNLDLEDEITIINPISNLSINTKRTVDGEKYRGQGLLVASFNLPLIVCQAIDNMAYSVNTEDERLNLTIDSSNKLHEISSLFVNNKNKTLSLLVIHLHAKSQGCSLVECRWSQLANVIENGLTATKMKKQITRIFEKNNAIKVDGNGLMLEDSHQKIIIYPSKVIYELKAKTASYDS